MFSGCVLANVGLLNLPWLVILGYLIGVLMLASVLAQQEVVFALVHDSVHALGGSISAEQGTDQLEHDALVRYKDPVELALMRSFKQAMDPLGIMNTGKC